METTLWPCIHRTGDEDRGKAFVLTSKAATAKERNRNVLAALLRVEIRNPLPYVDQRVCTPYGVDKQKV